MDPDAVGAEQDMLERSSVHLRALLSFVGNNLRMKLRIKKVIGIPDPAKCTRNRPQRPYERLWLGFF
jgi:hypothetical protein